MSVRNKPVSKPSAQIVETVVRSIDQTNSNSDKCNHDISESVAAMVNDAVLYVLGSMLPPQEKVLLILLLRNGLRVSEIVNSGNLRIIDNWTAAIYTGKNRQWRTIATAEASSIIEQYGLKDTLQYWSRNRFYYYRVLRGLLPDVETQRTGNKAVTHAARNARAQMTYEATGNSQAVTSAVGNKTVQATATYVKRSNRKAFIKQGVESTVSGTIGSVNITKNNVIRRSKSN